MSSTTRSTTSTANTTTTTTSPPPTPTCTACLDPIPPRTPHLLINRSPLCHPCFRQIFTLALASESAYPASWASHPLSATRYAHILGPELTSAYAAKEREYACPLQERVFCKRTDPPRRLEECGTFVGRWREVVGIGSGSADGGCVKCEKCAWHTCLPCEETFSLGEVVEGEEEVAVTHECDPTRDKELEERAFLGLTRGREWQVCPNQRCKRRVELSEGCNHVRCVCRCHFCFCCGGFVRDGEGHWRKEGGCPRFGSKGSERAIFDEGDVWDDNDLGDGDGGEEERVLREVRRVEVEEEDDRDGEEEGFRRAFEVQMRILEERRGDLEGAEARRLMGRVRGGGGLGGVSGRREVMGRVREVEGGEPRRRRRRRRRPQEERGSDEERRREPHHARRPRVEEDVAGPASEVSSEREPRRHRGFRAFLNDAVDAYGAVLFGGGGSKRRG